MKKKGFTLIELLAVIVILAVIALISMPLVLNIIDKIKFEAANESANSYVRAVETSIVTDMLNSNYDYDLEKTFKITNTGKTIKSNDKELGINIKGIYPSDGYVVIKDGIVIRGLIKINGYSINYEIANRCEIGETWNFDYTGSEQLFTVPCKGIYKLETWGAEGGGYSNTGGYGGYSVGNVELPAKNILYISSGESGKSSYQESLDGTFNGGGASEYQSGFVRYFSSGGGATHIATKSGLLSTLSNSISSILIVSGGGGGGYYQEYNPSINFALINSKGGSGGGYKGASGVMSYQGWGSSGYGGTQISGGYALCDDTTCSNNDWPRGKYGIAGFGYGGVTLMLPTSGGGGGFYGGGSSNHVQGAGGGSGYIGNNLLTDKTMYCYECEESDDISTKTISTTCINKTPTSNCAKEGNGYARITLVAIGN